jgi:hypothetical protein
MLGWVRAKGCDEFPKHRNRAADEGRLLVHLCRSPLREQGGLGRRRERIGRLEMAATHIARICPGMAAKGSAILEENQSLIWLHHAKIVNVASS